MTIDRALHIAAKLCQGFPFSIQNDERMEYHRFCYESIRAQQEAEENEPLTPGDLPKMGGEPVYAICDGFDAGGWFIVDLIGGRLESPWAFILVDSIIDGRCTAYRRPPKKEA